MRQSSGIQTAMKQKNTTRSFEASRSIQKGGDKVKARYNELGEKMVVFRARNRLSQADLAKMCGCSLQTINSVENGTQSPSKVTEAKIRLIVEKGE